MFRRIAQLLGFREKTDEALAQRFARIKKLYGEPGSEHSLDILAAKRTGLNMRAVVGARKETGDQLRKNIVESYARIVDERELVGTK
ncbi:MAG TPA: hypothetical protein V6D22_19525 [Candidatus Obscuribacterales bacterium]